MTKAPAFAGFPADTLPFLEALRADNRRDWFEANRARYEAAFKTPGEAFAGAIAGALSARRGAPYRAKIFRLHRDVRFSKDKTPYNTHLHIGWSADGRAAMWMFGVEPDALTVGAGVFAFDKPALEAYRTRVAGPEGAELARVIERLEKEGVRLSEPELKRTPSGFPPDHPREALLRCKGLAGWIDRPDPAEIGRHDIVDRTLAAFDRLAPIAAWLDAPR